MKSVFAWLDYSPAPWILRQSHLLLQRWTKPLEQSLGIRLYYYWLNSSYYSFTPLEWHTWNIKGIYVRAQQWTSHCLENLYHYSNRKSKEILCEYHIRGHYWDDVITHSTCIIDVSLLLAVFGYHFQVLIKWKRLMLFGFLG